MRVFKIFRNSYFSYLLKIIELKGSKFPLYTVPADSYVIHPKISLKDIAYATKKSKIKIMSKK